MNKRFLLVGLMCAIFKLTYAQSASPVKLDGHFSDEEWNGAKKQALIGGGDIRILQHSGELFIGLQGLKKGWSHLYVFNGEAIFVFHASAALGTGIYEKDKDGVWQPTQTFVYAARKADQSEEAIKARLAFFETNGWLANTNGMGDGKTFEFKLAKKIVSNHRIRMAAVYAIDVAAANYWPESLKDDCLKEELVFGNTPSSLKFDPNHWYEVKN